MRRSHFDFGWMLAEDGALLGLNLGYDRCAEHEQGIDGLLRELGVTIPEFPMGVGDRMVTKLPQTLEFKTYTTKPRDRRRNGYPAALLSMPGRWGYQKDRPVDVEVEAHRLGFYSEPWDKWHQPVNDLGVSWSRGDFAVHARGDANIARLKELHAAFEALDIAVAVPWSSSFFRHGVSFVIPGRMPKDEATHVLAQDMAHRELILAARATGIYETLKAASKGWHALSPDWYDRDKKSEVIFFLNPADQRHANHGWFTVQELLEWAVDRGPIVKDARLEEYAARPENYDWSVRLLRGMNAAGIKSRHHEKLVWMDAAKSVPGLRHRASSDTEHLLPSGDYPFADLMQRFAAALTPHDGATEN